MENTKFIKAEEMKTEPYSEYVERIRKNGNNYLAEFIEMEGAMLDSLEYLAEHHLEDILELYGQELLERHADKKWFELLNDYSENEDALGEILKAFDAGIDLEYVMEYLPVCSDEFEMSEKRSEYKQWKNNQSSHVQVEEVVENQKEESFKPEDITPTIAHTETVEDEYAGKVQDMLGISISECVEETIQDDSLENLMNYVSNAIVVSNKKDVHIEKLKRIIAAQNHYLKQKEAENRELIEENKALKERLLHVSSEKDYDAQKFIELQKKLSEIEEIKNSIGRYPRLGIAERC